MTRTRSSSTREARAPAIDQWDRYWRYGSLHSFSQVAGGNYDGAIARFWEDQFSALQDGSRLVDIATGNGALPLLALETGERAGRAFHLAGVDLANIDPPATVTDPALAGRLQEIEFHPRTPAEALPFDDASVDLACSQFGLEYSDLPLSVGEIARILRAGGRLAAVIHHAESVLLQATDQEVAQIDYVLDELRLYLKTRNLLRAMVDARVAPGAATERHPKVVRKYQAVQKALEDVRHAAEGSANPRMLVGPARYVREILAATATTPARELLRWLEEARARVMANRQRLLDMREAARSPEGMHALEGILRDAGLAGIEYAPLYEDGRRLLGWRLTASRPRQEGVNGQEDS